MTCGRNNAGGWVLVELTVSIALLGILLTGLLVMQHAAGRLNRQHWMRQQCTAAALAQLDSLTATGRTIEAADMQRLWPDVAVTILRSAGEGDWQRLTLVQAVASQSDGGSEVRVEQYRYIATRAEGE